MTKHNRAPVAKLSLAGLMLTVLALGAAPRARASFGELDITYPYTSLGSVGTSLSGVSGVANGLAVVPLSGWSFPFAGQNYNEITVTSDGYLTVGDATVTCGCAVGATSDNCAYCPSSPPLGGPLTYLGAPTYSDIITFEPPFFPGLIAPWWEDSAEIVYDYGGPQPTTVNGTVSTLQGGPPGSQYLIVDYSQVGPWADPPCNDVFTPPDSYSEICTFSQMPRSFQVQLFESGAIVFTYGTMDGTIEVPSWGEIEDSYPAIVGVWAPAAFDAGLAWTDAGTMFGPSGTDGNTGCMVAGWESFSDDQEYCYPYEDMSLLGSAYMGELEASFLTSSPAPVPEATANGVLIDVSLTVTNNGKSSQPEGFPVYFFLVAQAEPPFGLPTTCAPPMCLGQAPFDDAIPAGGQAVYTPAGFKLPNPLPPSGYYAIASVIDPTNTTVNATAPLLEIGTSTQMLPFGQDLTGKVELTTFSVDAGADFTVPLEFTNLGLETADSASYTLYFVDGAGGSTLAATGTLTNLGGLSSTLVNQDVPIPSNLAAGEYQLELVIGTGSPADLNPLNNTILGIQHVENGQDMTASIGAAPFAIPTPTTFSVPVTFHNLGLQPATNIPWTLSLTSATGISTPLGGDTISLGGLMVEEKMLTATTTQTLPSGPYTLSLQLGPNSLGVPAAQKTPDLNTANNTIIDPTPVFVYSAGADYAVGPGDLSLIGPPHAADGQEIGVWRTIHNLDGPAGPCPYGYFLNPVSVTQVGNGVPVAIVTKTGTSYVGMTGAFAAFGQPGAQDTRTEQILIPPGMPAGTYNLVLAVDPGNQVADTDPSNNDVATAIVIAANPVQITSLSLPAAIVDTPYVNQLSEIGAGTQPTWSLLAGTLPNGISMNSAGVLSGTPTQPGVFAIVVQVSSPNGTQVALLDLPVASGSAALSIEQSSPALPTATVGSPYLQQLEAQGGVPPYVWQSTLPAQIVDDNLKLDPSGIFSGMPSTPSDGPVPFTVMVTDSIGTEASATMTLRIIAPAGLVITTPYLIPAVVGMQYDQPIIATEGNSSGVTFSWSLPPGTVLPAGIMFQQIGNPAIADFTGKPTQAGIFPVVLNLFDNFGHNATRQYILTVAEAPIPVGQQTLPVAVIGASYITQLQANSLSTLTWGIFSGALPLGLALTPAGTISGTVDSSVGPGIDSFAVSVSDDTGAESVLPLYIQVQAPAPPSGGCATGGGPAGAGLLLLAVLCFGARHRRRDER